MKRPSTHRVPILGSLLVAGLMVFVLTPSIAAASPTMASSNTVSSWSYGAVKTINVPLQRATDLWMYEGNATFGFTVTSYENSTSANTLELTVFRTMGAAFSIRFCEPTCSGAKQWANQSAKIYESTATFANFTDQGTVYESGVGVPALALQNTTSFLSANVTESSDAYLPNLGQMGPHLAYLSANLAAQSSVEFTPALGLIPSDLTPGTSWNSSSNFVASGSAAYSYYYAAHAPVRSVVIGPKSGNFSLAFTGTVGLFGSYTDGSTFTSGGVTYPAITLLVNGPFDVREGVIFVPAPVDLFGSSSQPWGGNQSGAASATMGNLDIQPMSGNHLRIVASSWKYASVAANSADSSFLASPGNGLSPAASSANPVSSTTLQGEPESAEQATGNQQCLTTGGGCPSIPGGGTPRNWLGLIVVTGVAAVAASVIVLAVVSRRRKSPSPVYPNAVLYPPGAAYPSAPAGAPAPPGAPPAPEEDPLDHLW